MSKIGFLIPEFPGQTHAFFIRERNKLQELGVETELLSTQPPQSGAAAHQWAADLANKTTYIAPLGFKFFLLSLIEIICSGPKAWCKIVKIFFGKSDISVLERIKYLGLLLAGAKLKIICRQKNLSHIHIHSFANAANVGLFSYLLGGPTYSATLHGPISDYGSNQRAKWENAAFAIVITNDLLAQAKNTLGEDKLPRILLAPMGVDVDNFKRIKEYVPPRDNNITLVSCGRINYVKAHDDLIRVVALLKEKGINAQLRICGATDSNSDTSNYYQSLLTLAKELRVFEQVTFLGSISENEIKEELEACHFFCLASLHEPLGVATMEAMSMEVPTIVTSSPGVLEMVTHEYDGILVSPRAPEEFVSVIEQLLADKNKLIALTKNSRKTIVEKFHSGVSANHILNGIKKLY